jgi:hypothetical protein
VGRLPFASFCAHISDRLRWLLTIDASQLDTIAMSLLFSVSYVRFIAGKMYVYNVEIHPYQHNHVHEETPDLIWWTHNAVAGVYNVEIHPHQHNHVYEETLDLI